MQSARIMLAIGKDYACFRQSFLMKSIGKRKGSNDIVSLNYSIIINHAGQSNGRLTDEQSTIFQECEEDATS